MFRGLLFAIGACCVWGLIFIIPQALSDFSPIEVVLGRYLSYGSLSALLFFRKGWGAVRRFTPRAWAFALTFALITNLIYYLGIVAGLRFASPTLTVLIVGLAPISIAVYGNWQNREIAFRDLAIPCLWITLGLVLVNAIEVDWSFKGSSLTQYCLGILGILTALVSWTWYAVSNAQFLKRNPQILPHEWSTLIGVATLLWAVLIGAFFAIGTEEVDILKFCRITPHTLRFFAGVAILGFLCSWVGCFLWSRATLYLPISLMGPLVIFETLFGLLFVFIFKKQFPSWTELAGIASMVTGILMCIYLFRKQIVEKT